MSGIAAHSAYNNSAFGLELGYHKVPEQQHGCCPSYNPLQLAKQPSSVLIILPTVSGCSSLSSGRKAALGHPSTTRSCRGTLDPASSAGSHRLRHVVAVCLHHSYMSNQCSVGILSQIWPERVSPGAVTCRLLALICSSPGHVAEINLEQQ